MLITLHEEEIKEIIANHVYQQIAIKRQSGTEAIFTEQVKLNFDHQCELVYAEIDVGELMADRINKKSNYHG